MQRAEAEVEQAAATSAGDQTAEIPYERPETQAQLADLMACWPDDDRGREAATRRGLAAAERAAEGFHGIGEYGRAARAATGACGFETRYLDRRDSAVARLRRLREECERSGDAGWVRRCDQYLGKLARERSG